jgi:methionine-rich copper-binding protein CopC
MLLIGIAPSVWAHAFVDHAEPAVGSKLPSSPSVVKIWFTEALEPAFSKIQVFDSKGIEVDNRDAKPDPQNRQLLIVSVPILAPGKYKAMWQVVSVDSHTTSGSFEFEISP